MNETVKTFGRSPFLTKVKLQYIKSPRAVLEDLESFVTVEVPLPNFETSKPDLKAFLAKAILDPKSQENRVFRSNLDELIKQNIEETGIDPRVGGPPEHIKN